MVSFLTMSGVSTDDTLPVLANYDESIGEDPRLIGWWNFELSRTSVASGQASAVIQRAPLGTPNLRLVQTITAKQPQYVSAHAAFGNRPAIYFDQVASVDTLVCESSIIPVDPSNALPGGVGGVPVATAEWTKVIIGMANLQTATSWMCGGSPQSNGLHQMTAGISGGNSTLGSRVGTSGAQAAASTLFPADTPFIGICAWEGDTGTVSISVNGGTWATNTNSSAVCMDPTFALIYPSGSGTPVKLTAADVLLFRVSLHRPVHADMLGLVKQYGRDTSKLTVA
ncbi:hypothetical protein [Chelatococcus reniformis]|uniref:Uncharacterized protein n=1 Tax=Chelatococcus reniformis TaxID=1494448 RepID=A0A916U3K4_9HYPH|nr:hypothetical protein [Chelatococcus reniformis]GGC58258.1 hypothetical protein GCM10010994_16480 [Chelatococcus reniformis]